MWIDDSEDKYTKQGQQQANIGQGGAGTAPLGSNTSMGNPSTIAPANSAQPQQQQASIQDYLKGNQVQGEDLGQKVTSSLDTAQNQEKSVIDQAANTTKNDINNNTINYDADLVNKAKNDPTAVANNSTDFNGFLKQWNASYAGPQSFESTTNYNDAAKAANEAKQKQEQLKTTGGREQVIGDQFGVTGQGNKGLDQAILQNSSYFPKVQDQAKQFGSVQDYLTNQAKDVNNAAIAGQAKTDATKTATQDAFKNSLTDFQTGINGKVDAARQAALKSVQDYKADFASGDTAKIQSDLAAVGVDPKQSQDIVSYLSNLNSGYGIKPEIQDSFIANPNTDINAANVASADDYKRAAALKSLTGVDYQGVLNPADATKAGTGTFEKQALKSPDLSSYLKNSLGTQDKSLLGTTPTLDWNAVNKGTVTSEQAIKSVQQTIDAGQREGVDPKTNPALQSIESNAMQGLQAIIMGKENVLTRPQAKVYADAAVASMVAKGQTPEQAQQYINGWIQQLGKQVGVKNVPPIY